MRSKLLNKRKSDKTTCDDILVGEHDLTHLLVGALARSEDVLTTVPAADLDDAATVAAYKGLSRVERAFRSLKTVDVEIRPIYHWLSDRVRAHVQASHEHKAD